MYQEFWPIDETRTWNNLEMTHFCCADWTLSCLVSRLKTTFHINDIYDLCDIYDIYDLCDIFDIVDVNTEDEKVSKVLKQDCGCNERGRRQPQETF